MKIRFRDTEISNLSAMDADARVDYMLKRLTATRAEQVRFIADKLTEAFAEVIPARPRIEIN